MKWRKFGKVKCEDCFHCKVFSPNGSGEQYVKCEKNLWNSNPFYGDKLYKFEHIHNRRLKECASYEEA